VSKKGEKNLGRRTEKIVLQLHLAEKREKSSFSVEGKGEIATDEA